MQKKRHLHNLTDPTQFEIASNVYKYLQETEKSKQATFTIIVFKMFNLIQVKTGIHKSTLYLRYHSYY